MYLTIKMRGFPLKLQLWIFSLSLTVRGSLTAQFDEPMCTSRFDFEEKLLHKLVRMEHAMELLQERVTKELNTIKEENAVLKQEISSFRDVIKNEASDALQDLKQYELKLDEDRVKLATEFEGMLQQTNVTLQNMERDLVVVLNMSRIRVVFAVQGATGELVDGVPTFSTVRVNSGNAYNVSTGRFTCLKNGIYMFTFLLRSSSSVFTYCHIRKNGGHINYALSDGRYDMASVTVYLHLFLGDVVDLGGCENWSSARYDPVSVSFSGMEI